MKCKAMIEALHQDTDALYECLLPEEMESKRASMKVEKSSEGVILNITAEDAIALRAIVNSAAKSLTVCQKMWSL